MKSEIDIHNEPELALNALLDEINKQRKLNSELQSELRTMRTREIRLNKNSEVLKSDNLRLKQDLTLLEQKLREIEIQLTLPESERTFTSSRAIDPFPKKPFYKTFNWAFIIVPVLVIGAIAAFKWNASHPAPAAVTASVEPNAATPNNPATTTGGQNATASQATAAANAPVEEGYLVIQNPLDGTGMVRVMDGFTPKARVLAWSNPGDKYRIRAQSPTKMRRTYVKDGVNVTYEDYFYKISDKEQWVFGFFTSKKIAQ